MTPIKEEMLLVIPHIKFFVLLILVVLVTFCQATTEANAITGCVTNTSSCAQTYGDVYSALASQKNYFNIARALYPAKKPSSVLVHVRLYGSNGTENCTPANYTWSLSCLYAAFPSKVLEVLSLGSIFVTHRTQELNIAIAPFCCNVSEDDRLTMIDRVLAEVSKKCSLGISGYLSIIMLFSSVSVNVYLAAQLNSYNRSKALVNI